jgi:hypothetical protein
MSQPDPEIPAPPSSRIGVLRPLRHRDFAVLWGGMTISMVGDGIYYIAIAWQVYTISNRPTSLALVGIAWSAPQVLFVFLSGVLSDRLDRRRVMIAGDLIRLMAIGTIGVLSIVHHISIPLLVAIVTVYGTGQAVFQPSFGAIVPMIVPKDLLVEANSLAQFVRPFAMTLVGPLVGGILVAAVGTGWAFVADAATFGFSAVMIMLMRTKGRVVREAEEHPSVWQDVTEGLRFVRRERWLLIGMLGGLVSLLAVWGPWETLVPFVVRNKLSGSAWDLGLVFGAGGVGSVVAAVVMGQRAKLPKKAITMMYAMWAIGMFGTAGFGIVRTLWQAMLVALVTEGSITLLVVIWFTILQRLVPGELLGRVSSLDWMVSIAGVPLSFAIAGPAAAAFGADATLIVAGLVGGTITIAFMFVRGARTPERDGSLLIVPEGPAPAEELRAG